MRHPRLLLGGVESGGEVDGRGATAGHRHRARATGGTRRRNNRRSSSSGRRPRRPRRLSCMLSATPVLGRLRLLSGMLSTTPTLCGLLGVDLELPLLIQGLVSVRAGTRLLLGKLMVEHPRQPLLRRVADGAGRLLPHHDRSPPRSAVGGLGTLVVRQAQGSRSG